LPLAPAKFSVTIAPTLTSFLLTLAVLVAEEEARSGLWSKLGWLFGYFSHWWAIALQVIAIVHLIRRGGPFFWFFIIFMGGWIGAVAYFIIEMLPDADLVREAFQRRARRARIERLESEIFDNPSAGNYEELAEMFIDQREWARARQAYDHAIAARSDSLHSFYGRALCALELNDPSGAIQDLEHVVRSDGRFQSYRAASLLAHAYALTGRSEDAATLFAQVVPHSDTPETIYNYARFLKSQGRGQEAREWAQKILHKLRTMPRAFRRRERAWQRRAQALIKELKTA
jgi:hypothetical protein